MVIPDDWNPKSIETTPPSPTEEQKEAVCLRVKQNKNKRRAIRRIEQKIKSKMSTSTPSTPQRPTRSGINSETPPTPMTPLQVHQSIENDWMTHKLAKGDRRERLFNSYVSATRQLSQKQLDSIDEKYTTQEAFAKDKDKEKRALLEKQQEKLDLALKDFVEQEEKDDQEIQNRIANRRKVAAGFSKEDYLLPSVGLNAVASPPQVASPQALVDAHAKSIILRLRKGKPVSTITELTNWRPEKIQVTSTHLFMVKNKVLYSWTLDDEESAAKSDESDSVSEEDKEQAGFLTRAYRGVFGAPSDSSAIAKAAKAEQLAEAEGFQAKKPTIITLPAGAGNILYINSFGEKVVVGTDKHLCFSIKVEDGHIVVSEFESEFTNISNVRPGGMFCVVQSSEGTQLADWESKNVLATLHIPRHFAMSGFACGGSHIMARVESTTNNSVKILYMDASQPNPRLASLRAFTSWSNKQKSALGVTTGTSHSMVPLQNGGVAILGNFLGTSYATPQIAWPDHQFIQVRTADEFAVAEGPMVDGSPRLFMLESPDEEPEEIDISAFFDGKVKVAIVAAGLKESYVRVDLVDDDNEGDSKPAAKNSEDDDGNGPTQREGNGKRKKGQHPSSGQGKRKKGDNTLDGGNQDEDKNTPTVKRKPQIQWTKEKMQSKLKEVKKAHGKPANTND